MKSSGATLVTFRTEGGYLSMPRWSKVRRRGAVHGHPVGIYPPDALKTMSPSEINALIERDISEDAWERQRKSPVAFRGKKLAEGLEHALYLCPRCKKIGTLKGRKDLFTCSCGFQVRYTETGFFDPETPFQELAQWDDWQRKALRERDFQHAGELLFSDPDIRLTEVTADHEETLLTTAELRQLEDRLVCGDYSFAETEIENMADVLSDKLLFRYQEQYYQLRSDGSPSLRKYLEIWKEKH